MGPSVGEFITLTAGDNALARCQDDQLGKRRGLSSICVFSRALAYPDLRHKIKTGFEGLHWWHSG